MQKVLTLRTAYSLVNSTKFTYYIKIRHKFRKDNKDEVVSILETTLTPVKAMSIPFNYKGYTISMKISGGNGWSTYLKIEKMIF